MLEGVTAFSNTRMKPLTSKKLQRMEKKKKKLAAFLEIAKLNDKDREARGVMHHAREDSDSSDVCDNTGDAAVPREEPSRKRHKKNNEVSVVEPQGNLVLKESQPVPTSPVKSEELIHGNKPTVPPGFSDHVSCTNNLPPGFSENKNTKVTGEEYLKLKHELRERRSLLKNIPRFRLKETGENASIKVTEEGRIPLFLSDIQHLLIFAMHGHHAQYQPSRWCHVEKYNRLSHTVVLVIEGVSLFDFQSHESLFSNIADIFTNKVEVITPVAYGGSFIEELSLVPLSVSQTLKLTDLYGSMENALTQRKDLFKMLRAVFPVVDSPWTNEMSQHASDRFSRTMLLLSASQLIEEGYPLPLKGELRSRYADFVLTQDVYQEVTPSSPMFGVDCEMCRTTSGELELTRISIVNEQLEVLYENLVKPDNRITDYLTRFSGVTKELLADVTIRLEDVQRDIRALLPADAILVGQSLNFDMLALKMMHPYIIDTSVIYNMTGDRNRKSKLALLSHKFLGEQIQQSNDGHCSVEDSITSMKLTQLKLQNDIAFGDAVLSGYREQAVRYEQQSAKMVVASSFFSSVTKLTKSAAIIGSQEIINEYSNYMSESLFSSKGENKVNDKPVHCKVTSNEMVVPEMCNIAREHAFTLAHLQVDTTENKIDVLKQIDTWCGMVWEHLAYCGLCVVLLSGQRGGANGACFIEIRRPPVVSRRLSTSAKESIA